MLFELVGFIMCERFETINDFTAAALGSFPSSTAKSSWGTTRFSSAIVAGTI